MTAPAHRPDVRSALLRLYHSAEWVLAAAVVGAALLVEPELRDNLVFLGACCAWFVGMLLFARVRWLIRNETIRLTAGFVLTQLGIGSVLWIMQPALNGLLVLLVFATLAARLLLPRAHARLVMMLACAVTAAVVVSSNPVLPDIVLAIAVIGCCVLSARLAELAVRVTASAEATAAAAAGRDELTKLPGRHAFLRQAEAVHALAIEARTPYAVELIDINNLRAINDMYGCAAGDRAVVMVAQALQRLRGSDELLARFDGDKFVMLVPHLEADRADELARRIRSAVFSSTVDVDTEVVRIKANVGIARYPIAGVTLNALISAAERDMKLDQHGREPKSGKPVFRRRSGKMSA